MIARLEEIDALITHQINDPMLLRQPARPGARRKVSQGFGLANALEGIAQNGFDQIKSA